MSSIPPLSEWLETATTTVAVRPEYRENLKEEFDDWLEKAASVQVSLFVGLFAARPACFNVL
jgi:hypothetical protein